MSTTQAQPSITADVIMPFTNAVRQVFLKMVGIEAIVKTPHVKAQPSASYDVCGIIGFSGQLSGSVVLSFSDGAADKLVEAFAGSKIPRDSADFADAVGELANMVAGCAKPQLGASASISVPSVVIGKGYTVAAISSIPCIVIPCTSPFGDFAVEVSIKRLPNA